jgi:hypothetical protein
MLFNYRALDHFFSCTSRVSRIPPAVKKTLVKAPLAKQVNISFISSFINKKSFIVKETPFPIKEKEVNN